MSVGSGNTKGSEEKRATMNINISMRMSNESSQRVFSHESTTDSNRRLLIFKKAWITYGRLTVGNKGEVRYGSVRIYEGNPPKDEFATFSYIPRYEHEGEVNLECFSAIAHVPPDTFNYLLNLTDEQAILEAFFGFDITTGNFKYELNSINRDIYWDLTNRPEECPFEVASAIQISISKEEAQ